MNDKTIDDFISEIKTQYPPFTDIENDFNELKKTKFHKNECLFVWDPKTGEILFAKGFKNLLGIKDTTITLKSFTALFHENDKNLIFKIGQEAVKYSIKHPESNEDHQLFVSHRIKKSDGEFIKILAHTKPYQLDDKGYITKFLVIFSNINFVNTSDLVQYKFMATGLDTRVFHDIIFENHKVVFTKREMTIIREINNGHSSTVIADILKISKHTVATHRKKILKKSNCHSTDELLIFCKKNGILID